MNAEHLNMTNGCRLLTVVALALTCQVAAAGGDRVAGKEKSSTCVPCHGPTGDADNPQFPRIAGQYEDYLLRALLDYKAGTRNNPIMAGIVAGLGREDMENLAAYFAAQSGALRTPAP
jgi:cytochrome c553